MTKMIMLFHRNHAAFTLLCMALILSRSGAFAPRSSCSRRGYTHHQLHVLKDPLRSDNNHEDSEESIEEARKKLLLALDKDDNDNDKTSLLGSNSTLQDWRRYLEDSPPLTAVGRERILVEMDLLQALDCNSNVTTTISSSSEEQEKAEELAIRNLWYFWYNERGRSNTATLMAADQLVQLGTPESRKEAERMYRELITQEGLNWAEPLNRLATLLFYQGRYKEAKDLCLMVLTVKPWHFGCLTGIVMVCEKLEDEHGVNYWSRRRMPPMRDAIGKPTNEARREWVSQMTQQATALLGRGEKVNRKSFQAADDDADSSTGGAVANNNQVSNDLPNEDDENNQREEGSWE